jgi:hypothetical protein
MKGDGGFEIGDRFVVFEIVKVGVSPFDQRILGPSREYQKRSQQEQPHTFIVSRRAFQVVERAQVGHA